METFLRNVEASYPTQTSDSTSRLLSTEISVTEP